MQLLKIKYISFLLLDSYTNINHNQGCLVSVMDIGVERETKGMSSNPCLVSFICFFTNAFGKSMNQSLLLSTNC